MKKFDGRSHASDPRYQPMKNGDCETKCANNLLCILRAIRLVEKGHNRIYHTFI